MCVACDLGHPEACADEPDPPECVDCGQEADMFTEGHWICDACDDVREVGRAL